MEYTTEDKRCGRNMERKPDCVRAYEDMSTVVLEGRRGITGEKSPTTTMCSASDHHRGSSKLVCGPFRAIRRYFRAFVRIFQRKTKSPKSAEARILELSSGRNLEEQYDVDSFLHFGSFSEVKKGRSKTTGDEVAIKVVTGRCLDEHREVEIMMELNHRNIVQFQGVFLYNTTFAIVMELMETDLREIINHQDSLGEENEMAVLFEILQGLAYLGEKGFVHYDMKASNILLSSLPEVSVKIADFGLSEHSSVNVGKRGTHPYRSPDVMKAGSRPCQLQSDVWGVGITALAMCLGKAPLISYAPDDYNRVLEDITEYPFDLAMEGCTEERSPAWWDLVRRCLVVNPLQRQGASQLLIHQALTARADLSQLRPHIESVKNIRKKSSDSESFSSISKSSSSSRNTEISVKT